jgi:hypothetical protein
VCNNRLVINIILPYLFLVFQTNNMNSEDESDDGAGKDDSILKDAPAALSKGLRLDGDNLSSGTSPIGAKKGRKSSTSRANLKTVK